MSPEFSIKFLRELATFSTALADRIEKTPEDKVPAGTLNVSWIKPETYALTTPRIRAIINSIGALPRHLLGVSKKGAPPTRKFIKQQPCFYCGIKVKAKKLTLDHFIPLHLRGCNKVANLVPCCSKCNLAKGANLPTPHQVYKFHRDRPTVSLADLLEPYGFLSEAQQVRMDWFMTVWVAHVAAYRLRKHENLPLLSDTSSSVPQA